MTADAASDRTLRAMHRSASWLTFSEMGAGVTVASLTRLCTEPEPRVERRRARWGGETGQKHGSGYEYRLTGAGRAGQVAVAA